MEDTLTIRLPRKDVESFLRVVEDMRFIREAEKGDEEISKGKFRTLTEVKKKYDYA